MRAASLVFALALTAGAPPATGLDLTADGPASSVSVGLTVPGVVATSPASAGGTTTASLGLATDPTHGLVASSLQLTGGVLTLGDLNLSASGFGSIDVETSGIQVDPSSSALAPVAIAANTSRVPASAIAFEGVAGLVDPVSGDVCSRSLFTPRDLGTTSEGVLNDEDGDEFAEIQTVPRPAGGVDVTLTIPLDAVEQVIDGCPLAWIEFGGSLVVTGFVPSCSDTLDDDGDGFVDLADPGCGGDPASDLEDPACQDGIDNDADTKIDFDGGASANMGVPLADPDPQCGVAHRKKETRKSGCGLGFEAGLALGALAWLRSRATSRR